MISYCKYVCFRYNGMLSGVFETDLNFSNKDSISGTYFKTASFSAHAHHIMNPNSLVHWTENKFGDGFSVLLDISAVIGYDFDKILGVTLGDLNIWARWGGYGEEFGRYKILLSVLLDN